MTTRALLICREPVSPVWQLGPLRHRPTVLVGWRSSQEADAGLPSAIAHLLARAFIACGRVTFASEGAAGDFESWQAVGDDYVCVLKPRGLAGRTLAVLRGGVQSSAIELRSTRDPDCAARIFDEVRYPWWLQAQFGLLSAFDLPPPPLQLAEAERLMSDDWQEQAAELEPRGVLGAVRPGVDGDVAGVVLKPALLPVFVEALSRLCREGVLELRELSCAEFAAELSRK